MIETPCPRRSKRGIGFGVRALASLLASTNIASGSIMPVLTPNFGDNIPKVYNGSPKLAKPPGPIGKNTGDQIIAGNLQHHTDGLTDGGDSSSNSEPPKLLVPRVIIDVEKISGTVAAQLAARLLGHVLFLKNQIPL
jgi:hypothetical protein